MVEFHTAHLRPSAEDAVRAYREAVLANRQFIDALSPRPPQADYWERRAPAFRGAAGGSPEADALLRLTRPEDTWLDLGAGGGRYAVPLASHVSKVVAVEPSPSMRRQLESAAAELALGNIEVVPLEWPAGQAAVPRADGALVANVLYGVAEIGEFLDAMEAVTSRVCAVITFDRAPNTPDPEIWHAVHGTSFPELPALRELLAVLLARGRIVNVHAVPAPPMPGRPLDEVVQQAGWMYHAAPGSTEESRLRAAIEKRCQTENGLVRQPVVRRYASVVWWLLDPS